MAARARRRPLLGRRNGKPQQLSEACGSDPMHRRAHHHFAGFQVHMPRLPPAVEEDVQQAVYFADDLLIDRSSRFVSSGVQVLLANSIGRCWQIFSLTAISAALSFWRRWY